MSEDILRAHRNLDHQAIFDPNTRGWFFWDTKKRCVY